MDQEALINAMMQKGHSRQTAEATIQGRALNPQSLTDLYVEYLGGGAPATPGGYTSDLISTLTGEVVPQALEFDVEAARKAAEEEWGPYYDELLQDYLTEAALYQARSEADIASKLGLLGERREEFMGDIARESPIIQEQIGGRFADRGLYFGGEREEAQRRQLEKEERKRSAYEREYGYETGQAQLQQQRYVEDLERKRKERERELARQREQAITGGVETRREEKYMGWS
jgi:hypothetical protein